MESKGDPGAGLFELNKHGKLVVLFLEQYHPTYK